MEIWKVVIMEIELITNRVKERSLKKSKILKRKDECKSEKIGK